MRDSSLLTATVALPDFNRFIDYQLQFMTDRITYSDETNKRFYDLREEWDFRFRYVGPQGQKRLYPQKGEVEEVVEAGRAPAECFARRFLAALQ